MFTDLSKASDDQGTKRSGLSIGLGSDVCFGLNHYLRERTLAIMAVSAVLELQKGGSLVIGTSYCLLSRSITSMISRETVKFIYTLTIGQAFSKFEI